jgi:hypothetical protein
MENLIHNISILLVRSNTDNILQLRSAIYLAEKLTVTTEQGDDTYLRGSMAFLIRNGIFLKSCVTAWKSTLFHQLSDKAFVSFSAAGSGGAEGDASDGNWSGCLV